MKKTYISPISEEIRIQTTGMLAVSAPSLSDTAASVSGDDYENALSRELDAFFE